MDTVDPHPVVGWLGLGLCAMAGALAGAVPASPTVQVDLVAALERLPESDRIRKKIRARRSGLQAQVDAQRRRLDAQDLSEADREFERQRLNRSIDRMERDLAAEQDRLLRPLIARLEDRVQTLEAADLQVVDSTRRTVHGLSGRCDLTEWLASDRARPSELEGCRRKGIVSVRPAVAFAATDRAEALTRSLNARKAELEADLRTRAERGEDVRELARAHQDALRAAERRAQDEADATTRRTLRAWSEAHPEWVIVELGPTDPVPEGACDATATLAKALREPQSGIPEPRRWCSEVTSPRGEGSD